MPSRYFKYNQIASALEQPKRSLPISVPSDETALRISGCPVPNKDIFITYIVRHSRTNKQAVISFQEGAPFAGLQVRSLGLPAGCILVRCYDGKREWIPKATTHLQAHMRITTVIAPDASGAVEILRKGCEAPRKKNTLFN